ncbi:glycosyl transferase family 1, partial [Halorubrum saccharovorum]
VDDALADAPPREPRPRRPLAVRGFGIVYLEGMSFGLPAIASRAGGASETVTDGETGVLVDPDDPDAVARALDEFAADPDRLAEMSRAARRRYERHPSWAESTALVRRLLAEVVADTGSEAGVVA